MKYNGWTNWETWNFKLWMDNTQDSYWAAMEMAEGKKAEDLSKELEAWANDILEATELESGFFADICNSAIKEVNFFEIAEAYVEEVKSY